MSGSQDSGGPEPGPGETRERAAGVAGTQEGGRETQPGEKMTFFF